MIARVVTARVCNPAENDMAKEPCSKAWCYNPGRRHYCLKDHNGHINYSYGRTKDGKRWFWHVYDYRRYYDDKSAQWHGWAGTEDDALEAAFERIRADAGDRPVHISTYHSISSSKLQDIRKERQRAKLANRKVETQDGAVVEYLYAGEWNDRGDYDGAFYGIPRKWVVRRFRITKRTKKRIYYCRAGEIISEPDTYGPPLRLAEAVSYVDRQAMEASGTEGMDTGKSWYSYDYYLYLQAPPEPVDELPGRTADDASDKDTMKRLKAEMAAAHPDRGGSNEAFREAREAYVRARRMYEANA